MFSLLAALALASVCLTAGAAAAERKQEPRAWELTSGSLEGHGRFASTASPVFRLNTARAGYRDVAVSLDLITKRLFTSPQTPAVAWDGVHVWLRYQSEYRLYAASFNRRDGRVVIKKKCPGGGENGGTYYELGRGEVTGFPIPFGAAQHLTATVDNVHGAVAITMFRDGERLLAATDRGLGCAPITAPGAVGIRGDNAEFSFDDFAVSRR